MAGSVALAGRGGEFAAAAMRPSFRYVGGACDNPNVLDKEAGVLAMQAFLELYELTGGWREMNNYMEGIRKVTREDVQRVAKKYLNPDQRTIGTLLPQARRSS